MARGGKRAGAGRKPGVPNKASRELKELAREYTEEAVGALVRVLRDKEAPASAQVAAATAILDRGHGKPTQHKGARDDRGQEMSDTEFFGRRNRRAIS